MLNFDKENKITFEQLSFSLQNKLRKLVPKSEIQTVDNMLTDYENALNNVRFSFVNRLTAVDNPTNNQDVAILNNDGTYTIYAYAGNRWVKIPTNDIYYRLRINQSWHQTITVVANGVSYTSTVNLKYGTNWTASVIADRYYTAGTLSASSGILEYNDEIDVSDAIFTKAYDITANMAKLTNAETYGVKINWSGSSSTSSFFGSFDPIYLLDEITVTKSGSAYTSLISFYGAKKPPDIATKITLTLTDSNNNSYSILSGYSISNFTASGDLKNYGPLSTEYYYNIFKGLKGKTAHIYLTFGTD